MKDEDDILLALGALYAEQERQTEAALDAPAAHEGLEDALAPLSEEERRAIVERTQGAEVVTLGSWRRRAWVFLPVLLAAVLLFALWPQTAPLYTMELSRTGDAVLRGEVPPQDTLRPGYLELVLRPAGRVHGEVQVQASFLTGSQRVAWAAEVEQAPSGVLRLSGQRPALAVGQAELQVQLTIEGRAAPLLTQTVQIR